MHITELDEQRAHRKQIFGGGLLLSDLKASEKAAAERAAARRWKLSERELTIVAELSKMAPET